MLEGPEAHGYPTPLWTCRRVTRLIKQEFGIVYHPGHVWKILVRLGWSPQRPVGRARERNEEQPAKLPNGVSELRDVTSDPALAGHQKMLQLLRGIKERTPKENSYLGDAGSQQAHAQLATLPPIAPDVMRLVLNGLVGYP